MTGAATRTARYEDLLELPDHLVGEIIDGELSASPRPAGLHAVTSSALGFTLGPPFAFGSGGPGGWWILDEPEHHLGSDILVPDLAGWRRARMPEIPSDPHFTLPPDWICEVLSPGTARLDRGRKRDIYAREGVQFLWLVSPQGQSLEAFLLEHGRWLLSGTFTGTGTFRIAPFDAVEIELGRLWGE